MAYEFVTVEREGPITIVTLNRPEVMNALHSPAHFELGEVFDAFAADPEQWVAIVTGAGERAFSAGNDLKHQATGGKMGPRLWQGFLRTDIVSTGLLTLGQTIEIQYMTAYDPAYADKALALEAAG